MRAEDSLLSRAAGLLPTTCPLRPAVLTDLGEVLRETGEFERAEQVLREASDAAATTGDAAVAAHARLVLVRLRMQTDTAVTPDDLIHAAQDAIALFETLGDQRRPA